MADRNPFLSVYGHVTIDQIISVRSFPALNESVDVISKKTTLGGTGTNIALTAARLGVPTALCAFVGDDFPSQYEDLIRESGIIMDDFVRVGEYESSQAMVFNNSDLEQKVVFYQGPQGFAGKLNRILLSSAKKSEYVHFCTGEPGYYIELMKELRAADVSVSVDPAQEIYKMWDAEKMRVALSLSDAMFCNEFEAKVAEKYLDLTDIMCLDKSLVVRTEGSKGSTAKIDGRIVSIPAVKCKRFADATGAGDAFRAGYYAGLYYGYDIHASLVLAATVSSFVVESVGAIANIPTWDMVLERADDYLRRIR